MLRFFILLICSFLIFTPAQADDKLSDQEKQEVRDLVRDTILSNPEILVEAMTILQKKQETARLDAQKTTLKSIGDSIDKGPLTPTAGNPNGDVTLIEFFDYQCGYCKRAFPGVMEVVNGDKNLRYVLKEFAILGPQSEIAARAALAAQKQNKYMELHTALMTLPGRLNEDKILKTAESVGLDVTTLQEDMKGDDVTAEIMSTRAVAQRLGLTGTPAFIIGDQIIPGAASPDALKDAIEKARSK